MPSPLTSFLAEEKANLRNRRGRPEIPDKTASLLSGDGRSQVTSYLPEPSARHTESLAGAATPHESFPGPAAHSNGNATPNPFPTTAIDLLTSMGRPPTIPLAAAPPGFPIAAPNPVPGRSENLNSYQDTKPLMGNSRTTIAASAAAKPAPDSLDGKVGSWEKRYGKMDTQELMEMQRVLVEILEDTTTRMVAMQKVLAGRQ